LWRLTSDTGRFSKLTDQELDRLFTGKAPLGEDDLGDLAGFLRDVREGCQRPPSTETAARHLAAITQAAARAASDVTTGETLAAASRRPATSRSIGRFAVRNPLSHTRTRLAIVVGAAALMLAAFGGIAHAGALPTPVQHTVSDLVGSVGIDVPN
jgi:hypothetical protein